MERNAEQTGNTVVAFMNTYSYPVTVVVIYFTISEHDHSLDRLDLNQIDDDFGGTHGSHR